MTMTFAGASRLPTAVAFYPFQLAGASVRFAYLCGILFGAFAFRRCNQKFSVCGCKVEGGNLHVPQINVCQSRLSDFSIPSPCRNDKTKAKKKKMKKLVKFLFEKIMWLNKCVCISEVGDK